jgi:hypothetical protein
VRVAFAGRAPDEPGNSAGAGRAEAEAYADEIATWLEESWRELAHQREIPCRERRELSAQVELKVDAEGRVVAWRRRVERSSADHFEDAVEQLFESLRGHALPPPPALRPELVPRGVEVELTNHGLPC